MHTIDPMGSSPVRSDVPVKNKLSRFISIAIVTSAASLMVACGGNLAGTSDDSGTTNNGTNPGDNTGDQTPVEPVTLNLINTQPTLEATESTQITAQILNSQGLPTAGNIALNVTSPCITQGSSQITGSLSGTASSLPLTYEATTCTGEDPITVAGTFNGQAISGSTTITINSVQLNLTVEDNTLILNQSTGITAHITNSAGQPVTGEIKLAANSNCIVENKSSITGDMAPADASSVTNLTYATTSCLGADVVSVAGTFNGQDISAQATITSSEATQGIPASITFESNMASLTPTDAATLTLRILTSNGSLASGQYNIELVSTCLSNGTSKIEGTTSTENGSIEVSYQPNGCKDADVITARVTSPTDGSLNLEAQLTLNVDVPLPDGISWVQNSPSNSLNILGAGGVQNVTVEFALTANSVPVPNENVTFSLRNSANEDVPNSVASLVTTSGSTDSNGRVTALVKSGTRRGQVKVVITHTPDSGTPISAESKLLSVRGGFAQDFSLSVSNLNPNALYYIGDDPVMTVRLTATLDDKEGDHVPDGATVLFQQNESFGQFQADEDSNSDGGSCVIENGTCSVMWHPDGSKPADGRVTFIAYVAGGHEQFLDNNDNGLFDAGDDFPIEPADDLSEPFYDKLRANAFGDNGVYATFDRIKNDDEHYKDTLTKSTNSTVDTPATFDGEYTPANGLWDGPASMCSEANEELCSGNTVTLWDTETIVLSGDTVHFCQADGTPAIENASHSVAPGNSIMIPSGLFQHNGPVYLCDENGNPLPAGTEMVWTEVGEGVLGGTGAEQWGTNLLINQISEVSYSVPLTADDASGGITLAVIINIPGGLDRQSNPSFTILFQ